MCYRPILAARDREAAHVGEVAARDAGRGDAALGKLRNAGVGVTNLNPVNVSSLEEDIITIVHAMRSSKSRYDGRMKRWLVPVFLGVVVGGCGPEKSSGEASTGGSSTSTSTQSTAAGSSTVEPVTTGVSECVCNNDCGNGCTPAPICDAEGVICDCANCNESMSESATSGPATSDPPESSTGAPAQGCQQLTAAMQQLADEYCPCAVQTGLYPDIQGCVDAKAEPTVMPCRCDVYAQFPDTDAALQCQADAIPTLLACLKDAMCATQAQIDQCLDDYQTYVMAMCPPLDPTAVDAAKMQCG